MKQLSLNYLINSFFSFPFWVSFWFLNLAIKGCSIDLPFYWWLLRLPPCYYFDRLQFCVVSVGSATFIVCPNCFAGFAKQKSTLTISCIAAPPMIFFQRF